MTELAVGGIFARCLGLVCRCRVLAPTDIIEACTDLDSIEAARSTRVRPPRSADLPLLSSQAGPGRVITGFFMGSCSDLEWCCTNWSMRLDDPIGAFICVGGDWVPPWLTVSSRSAPPFSRALLPSSGVVAPICTCDPPPFWWTHPDQELPILAFFLLMLLDFEL